MSREDIPKGAIVIIDDETPGKLRLSDRAYDTRVAGVVSGANGINPGITMHQDGSAGQLAKIPRSPRMIEDHLLVKLFDFRAHEKKRTAA